MTKQLPYIQASVMVVTTDKPNPFSRIFRLFFVFPEPEQHISYEPIVQTLTEKQYKDFEKAFTNNPLKFNRYMDHFFEGYLVRDVRICDPQTDKVINVWKYDGRHQ